jgi:hypothetical protein
MKKFEKIVLGTYLLFALTVVSCSDDCDSYPGNSAVDMGDFYVNPKNEIWFVDSVKTIYFKNSNGLIAPFTLVNYVINIEGFQTDLQMRYPTFKCGREGMDYCKLFYDRVQYSSEVAGIYYTITREVNVPKSYPENYSHKDLVNSPEIIKVSISRNSNFFMQLNQDTNVMLINQIKLIDSTCFDVYELSKVKTTNSELNINKVYYKKRLGLVGFVLSNGEIWEKL